jgi:uncharacterized Rossmann fold enzyme
MNFNDWNLIYKKIAEDLNLNIEKDILAANILNKMLTNKKFSLKKIKKIIENKEVIVFGAGNSLKKSIKNHKNELLTKIKISADGATSALLKNDIYPEIIVTDLDGKISDQIKSNKDGSIVVLHAHGENISQIKNHLFDFKENILGTTQINPKPFENLYNFGGFTDGDRAVFLADFFNAKKIYLVGFDFDGSIGKYSFSNKKDKTLKLKKLKWCKYLLSKIKEENKNIQEL